ncbi:hypothetical protein [Pontibacter cellulosilyticus]|uniref:Secreted protein n=1 Tax=Pontibacter cellulosilyticus TaxID=1720253 RepID=A0A923SN64_9BACT|nr:hypothetical protein [Pontibacter cellulosilyticus]MBC5992875.1 hypothetical protein [Pontibacter cellulosilyticus]
MKNVLSAVLLYLGLSVLVISCSEAEPEPNCIAAEVIEADCGSGWYILKLEEKQSSDILPGGSYVGQLQGGYVTTDNLPQAYRQPGLKLRLALEINGEYSPLCVTVAIMYQAVKVKNVCVSSSAD